MNAAPLSALDLTQHQPDENQLIRELVGRNIMQARLEAGLTQEQLSERLKVSRNQVCMWERGRRQPSAKFLTRIADKLGHTRGWFLDEHSSDATTAAAASAP